MTTTTPLTPYQMLRSFNEATCSDIRLRPFETIVKCAVTDTSAVLVVDGLRYVEQEREYRVSGGYRTMTLITPLGAETITVESDVKPHVIKKFDFHTTPREQVARRDWERMCHRPGDGSRFGQRDSYERSCQGTRTVVGGAL